jgi:CheY-like chemotaxis protein
VKSAMNDILVVDDNPALLGMLEEVFKWNGYTVRTASDGFEALAAIRDRLPDVLLSDLNMPRMSGFELLSIVRRRFPTMAVIAMSGDHSGTLTCRGIAADGFYPKGAISIARLFEILSEIDDEGVRQFRRAAAPIWIPGVPIHQSDRSTTAVACPECLRAFSHPLNEGESLLQECHCPHCSSPVRLAFVRQPAEMDKTALTLPATENTIGPYTYSHETSVSFDPAFPRGSQYLYREIKQQTNPEEPTCWRYL